MEGRNERRSAREAWHVAPGTFLFELISMARIAHSEQRIHYLERGGGVETALFVVGPLVFQLWTALVCLGAMYSVLHFRDTSLVHILAAIDLLRCLAWQRENHYFPIPVSLAYRRDEAAAGQTRVIVITFADVDFHNHGRVYVNTIIPAMTWAGGHRVPWFGDMADVNGRPSWFVGLRPDTTLAAVE